jgi:hypothetical protein
MRALRSSTSRTSSKKEAKMKRFERLSVARASGRVIMLWVALVGTGVLVAPGRLFAGDCVTPTMASDCNLPASCTTRAACVLCCSGFGGTCVGDQCGIVNVQFRQVDWFGSQAPAINDSEWGELSLDITPAADIEYINIIAGNANGSGGPSKWIVRNLPTLPLSTDPSTQTFVTTFDFGLLGIARGTNASFVDYRLTVDATPRTSPPSGSPDVLGVLVGDVSIDAEGKGPGPAVDPGSPPDLSTLNFNLGSFHFHWQVGVPNLDLDNSTFPGDYNGCAPAAVANSMKWLGVGDPLRDIFDDVSAAANRPLSCAPGCANAGAACTIHANCMGCPPSVATDYGGGCIDPNGTPDARTIAAKLQYNDDNQLGLLVKFQDDQLGGANYVTPHGTAIAKGKTPTFAFIEKELDDDEDVEMGFTFYRCNVLHCLRDGNADGIADVDAGDPCAADEDCDALAPGDELGACGRPECEVDADCPAGGLCAQGTNNGTACTTNAQCTGGGICRRCVVSGGHFVTVVGKIDLGFAQGLWTKDDAEQAHADAVPCGIPFFPACGTRTKFGWLRTRGDNFLETTAFSRNQIDIVVSESPSECPPFSFLVRTKGKVGNGGTVDGGIGSNDAGGLFRLGKSVTITDGHTIAADAVKLGSDASVFDVRTNKLKTGGGTIIRGSQGPATLPLTNPFCPIPAFTCGGTDVNVPTGSSVTLAPGSYNRLIVGNGATVTLSPAGTFSFCSVRTGRSALVETTGGTPSTVNVVGTFRLLNSTVFGPASGTPTPDLNVDGRLVRVSQAGVLHAFVSAPNALISVGRSGNITGSFCAATSRSDRSITLNCEGSTTTSTTVTTTTSTTTTTMETLCCDVPPGALGNPVPVCLDAVLSDVTVKCALLGGTLHPLGFVCDPDLEQCAPSPPVPPSDFCCECPVPAPPFPHDSVCFEGVTTHEFKCQPPCVLHPALTCGPVSERCGGSPSGAFVDSATF